MIIVVILLIYIIGVVTSYLGVLQYIDSHTINTALLSTEERKKFSLIIIGSWLGALYLVQKYD